MSMTPNCSIPGLGAGAGKAISIARDGDLVIRLAAPKTPLAESTTVNSRLQAVEFLVSRGVMRAHSTWFRDLFRVQPTLTIVSIDDNPGGIKSALEIWLRAIHHGAEYLPLSLKALHSRHVWAALAVGKQFGFATAQAEAIKTWFVAYYNDTLQHGPGLTPVMARTLAYPCLVLDHAEGFMKLTKYLVYHTYGGPYANNTSSFENLSIDARLLDGPLARAKSRVQDVLERGLRDPLDTLHHVRCTCRKETAFDYEDALIKLGCWPLEKVLQKATLSEIFDKLNEFRFVPSAANCESGACTRDLKKDVENAIDRAKHDCDGLCLDCMNRSKRTDGQPRAAYVDRNTPYKGCWDMGCRYGHGRETWVFSWMGPRNTLNDIIQKEAREKRQHAQASKVKTSKDRTRRSNGHLTPRDKPRVSHNSDAAVPVPPNSHHDDQNPIDQDSSLDMDGDEFFDAEDNYFDESAEDEEIDN